MSVQKRKMAVSSFAEIQFAPIIVCVEMDIISIKMGNLAWVGMLYSIKSLSTFRAVTILKVMSATFLLVCFLRLKESTCETRKNVFYFTSKALFVLEIIKF